MQLWENSIFQGFSVGEFFVLFYFLVAWVSLQANVLFFVVLENCD